MLVPGHWVWVWVLQLVIAQVDQDSSGTIEVNELFELGSAISSHWTVRSCQALFNQMNRKHDGRVRAKHQTRIHLKQFLGSQPVASPVETMLICCLICCDCCGQCCAGVVEFLAFFGKAAQTCSAADLADLLQRLHSVASTLSKRTKN